MEAVVPRCHRERRFHVRPEALGHHYYLYDVAAGETQLPTADSKNKPDLEEQAVAEKDNAQRRARNGLIACIVTLVLIIFGARLDWVFKIYLAVIRLLSNHPYG